MSQIFMAVDNLTARNAILSDIFTKNRPINLVSHVKTYYKTSRMLNYWKNIYQPWKRLILMM